MKKNTTYSPEVRVRAVRMVLEHLGDYPSGWAVIESIAPKIGCEAHTVFGRRTTGCMQTLRLH